MRNVSYLLLIFQVLPGFPSVGCDVAEATKILRMSWEEAWGIMERAVTRGRRPRGIAT